MKMITRLERDLVSLQNLRAVLVEHHKEQLVNIARQKKLIREMLTILKRKKDGKPTMREKMALTLKRNRAMTALYNAGGLTYTKIGKAHGISGTRVSQIVKYRNRLDKEYTDKEIFFILSEMDDPEYCPDYVSHRGKGRLIRSYGLDPRRARGLVAKYLEATRG
jgi:hypothetical protein